jgi:hypothetical protein
MHAEIHDAPIKRTFHGGGLLVAIRFRDFIEHNRLGSIANGGGLRDGVLNAEARWRADLRTKGSPYVLMKFIARVTGAQFDGAQVCDGFRSLRVESARGGILLRGGGALRRRGLIHTRCAVR